MTAKLTNPVFISWYLSVIFLLGLLTSSAITVVPGGEAFVRVTMSVCLACVLVFAFLALLLRHRARRGLDFGVSTSQPFRVGYAVLALIITLVLFVVAGA
jgi:hypothetical protein